MTTVQDVLTIAKQLTPVEQLEIIQVLARELQQHNASTEADHSQPRVLGLHAGQVWISDDFDTALPDEFWLGSNDAPVA